MTASILDFAAARAARTTGQPIRPAAWTPPPPRTPAPQAEARGVGGAAARLGDLEAAHGFRRGDIVLLPAEPTVDVEPSLAGRAGTIVRLFDDPRTGQPRAHVAPKGHMLTGLCLSVPLATLRHDPAPRHSGPSTARPIPQS